MQHKALLVGNSDGIGLAATNRLLAADWDVIGVSRSASPLTNAKYHHRIADVSDDKYSDLLKGLVLEGPLDLCVYFVGIGELLDPLAMSAEARIMDVKPFMMSIEKAVDHLEACIKKRPARYCAPKIMIPLIKLRKRMIAFGGH